MKILSLLYGYRFSILLTILIFVCFFYIFGLNLFGILFQELFGVKWQIFVFTFITGYIGSISFVLPFYILARKNKTPFFKLCLETLKWTHQTILNENYDKTFIKNIRIKDRMFFEKVKFSDIIAILIILLLTYPFIKINTIFFSFVLIFELVYIFYFIFLQSFLLKKIFYVVLASILRYFFEIFTPFLIFLSTNIFLDLPTLLFFTASTSLLYYIPKFKLAGGLLDLYLVLMFYFLGQLLLGLVVAILFRLSSLIFFVLPLSILKIRKFK